MAEVLDDSILNADSSGAVPDIDPLDDARIAELLADPEPEDVAAAPVADALVVDLLDESDENPAVEEAVEMIEDDPEAQDQNPLAPPAAAAVVVVEDEGFDEVDPEEADRPEEPPIEEVEDVPEEVNEVFGEYLEMLQNRNGEDDAVVISDDENEVQIYEDITGEIERIDDDDQIIIDDAMDAGEGTSSSRKRTANGHGPQAKRQRSGGRLHPFFEARRAAIDLVVRTLGSWDNQLTVPHLRMLKELHMDNYRQIHQVQKQTIDELYKDNERLREELAQERKSHGAAIAAIRKLGDQTQAMRQRIDELSVMVTQPRCITIFDDIAPSQRRIDENAREVAEMEAEELKNGQSTSSMPAVYRQQQAMQPQRRQVMVPAQQQHNDFDYQFAQPRRVIQRQIPPQRKNFQAGPILLPDGSLPSVRGRTAAQAVALLARAGMVQPAPQPQRPQFLPPAPGGPRWAPIPTPVGMGHLDGTLEPKGPQSLMDKTRINDNTIKLLIPYVPASLIISTGDSSRLPRPPPYYSHLQQCPDLTVTITSSQQDFRENWQIGGRINYEYLGFLEDTTIQIYIQVASLKFNGMNGSVQPDMHPIDWGISQPWPCKSKSQKFRVLFHQKQLIPVNDRITILVVAKNDVQKTTQISVPVFMTLQ